MTIALKAARFSLWLLVLPAALMALDYLVVGITFGSALWKWSDPAPTVLWAAVVGFPICLVVGLRFTRSSAFGTTTLFATAWLLTFVWTWSIFGRHF